jgi:hypothetical protein
MPMFTTQGLDEQYKQFLAPWTAMAGVLGLVSLMVLLADLFIGGNLQAPTSMLLPAGTLIMCLSLLTHTTSMRMATLRHPAFAATQPRVHVSEYFYAVGLMALGIQLLVLGYLGFMPASFQETVLVLRSVSLFSLVLCWFATVAYLTSASLLWGQLQPKAPQPPLAAPCRPYKRHW